jgi:hypothetical protein
VDELSGRETKPTSAVNTASIITRGFINVMKSGNRGTKLDCEANLRRDKGFAVGLVVGSQPSYISFTPSRFRNEASLMLDTSNCSG